MNKEEIAGMLKAEFGRWEALLAELSEEEITARQLDANLSIKDVMVHLWAWQRRTVARMEAALSGREPELPAWPPELDPDADDPAPLNAWIHAQNRERPWSSVRRDWRETFLRLIEQAEAVPEKDLLEPGRYEWLGGEPLSIILVSSYDHHHEEHYGPLVEQLKGRGHGGGA
jgi:hypothetical protein